MGISASSLLDENKSAFIRGQAEAELARFSPFYRRQFSVARFCQAQEDLEPHQEKTTQLLRQRPAPEEGEVLFEDAVLYFDDSRKWRERYLVVRANYCLECHDSLKSFLKGAPPGHKLLPTGGAVLTTEERYMALVDKCFPGDSSVKEDFAPPLSSMPGQFPVYLRLPYRRDSYFCFRQQLKQETFISILWDCIRHQNQDFLKKTSCEVQAFLKAIQFYRESKGRYESWDMLIGSDVRVLSNVVMEQLLPSLEKDLLPKLKAKKTEKKRVWFATVEAAYFLVHECLLEGLSSLKDDCRTSLRPQEVLIHSDMDQILRSRSQTEERVRASVSAQAEVLCSEQVQPYLSSVLEELMGPISSGFTRGRELCEDTMDRICQDVLQGVDSETVRKALLSMSRLNLQGSYQKMASLQDKPQLLQDRFRFRNVTGVVHSAQIDLQQLMENAAFTFESLLYKAVEDHQDHAASAIDKAKHRVLKQFDYDSSSVRKRIFQNALFQITLPFLKEHLQETRAQIQDAADHVFLDHCNFIEVENVYEDVLLSILHKEVSKVLKEAASLRKYNLLNDSRDLLSHSSLSSTSGSVPGSPALSLASSPCTANHSPPTVTAPHTPTKTQEVQSAADPADAQTVETNENKMAAKVENANPESASNERQEAKVVVEEIGDISEETGKEIQAKTEQMGENKMVEKTTEDNAQKQEDVLMKEEEKMEVKEETKMTEPGEKIAEKITAAAEDKAVANDEVKMSETDKSPDEVFDVKEENVATEMEAKVETKMEDAVEKVSEEVVPKQEVVLATDKEVVEEKMSEKVEENVPEEKTTGNSDVETTENKMAEEAQTEVKITEVCEAVVSVTEKQEVEAELGAPSGGEAEATAAEQKVLVSNKSEFVKKEKEEEEDGSDDEGSTTSDVLEENSQSPLSSENEGQSEERREDSKAPAPTENSSQETPEEGTHEDRGQEVEQKQQEVEQKQQEVEQKQQEVEQKQQEVEQKQQEVPGREERPLDCVRSIRELVQEVIEVEELLQRFPAGVPVEIQGPGQDQD